MSSYRISGKNGDVEIVTLTREQSFQFYELQKEGEKKDSGTLQCSFYV